MAESLERRVVCGDGCGDEEGRKRDVILGGSMGRILRAMISSKHAFTLGKSYLTNLFAFCIETARSVTRKTAVSVIYVELQPAACCAVASAVLADLKCCSLEGWTTRCMKTCQGH